MFCEMNAFSKFVLFVPKAGPVMQPDSPHASLVVMRPAPPRSLVIAHCLATSIDGTEEKESDEVFIIHSLLPAKSLSALFVLPSIIKHFCMKILQGCEQINST